MCLLPAILMLSSTAHITAAQPASAPTQVFAYETVSIRLHDLADQTGMMRTTRDRFTAKDTSLENLLMTAYELNSEDQISGLRGPVAEASFDVEAKMDHETSAALDKMTRAEKSRQMGLMMQAVLAERFHLQVHRLSKEMPVYSMVVAKGGIKAKESDPKDAARAGNMSMGFGVLTGFGMQMEYLAINLQGWAQRIIKDDTGLKGKYDIALKWVPDDAPHGSNSGGDEPPPLFVALQEQLGLRLVPTKGIVDTIVIDHVEMPSAN